MCSLTLQVSEKGNFCIRGNVPFMPSLPSSPELRSASRHRSSHRWSRAGFKGWRRASQPAAEQVDVAPPKPAIPQCWPVLLSLSTRLTRQSYEWRKGDTDGPFSVPALNPFAALSEGVRLTRLGDDTERLHGSTCKCHMMIPVSDAADDSCHDCRREGRSVGWERPGKQGKLLPGHCPWHWPGESGSRMLWAWCCSRTSGWHTTFPGIRIAPVVSSLQGSNVFVQAYCKYFLCSLTHCSAV